MTQPRRTPRTVLAALFVSTALALTSCAGDVSGATIDSETGRAEQLTMQFTGPPTSLDPTLGGTGGSTAFVSLAYDPLIYLDRDGKYVPNLAESWEFLDKDNTEFRMEIRDGVKYSTGEDLTPSSVEESLEYFMESAGSKSARVGPIEEVSSDETGVTVKYSSPFPDAPLTMTQEYRVGNVISPEGVSNPDELLKTSYGAGPYILSGTETIPDSEYVYDLNPDYWNPDAQLYDKVVIKVIGDPNAVVSAVTTGQVDIASGNSTTYDVAKDAGLEIDTVPFFNWSLFLADMDGVVNPALKEPKVRQAIAMSLDREAIANAVHPDLSVANGQIMNEGTPGWVEGLDYEYNVDKAKSLLAEAGYPDGFELTILTQNTIDSQTMRSQAIADAIEKIGIKVNLEVITTGIANFTSEALTKKYEAVIFPISGTTMGNVQREMLTSGNRNPFEYVNKEIQDLYEASLRTSDEAERLAIYEDMSRAHHDLAYVIPVFTAMNVKYAGPAVTNVGTTANNPTSIPNGPTKELSWQPKVD
ncbi:ABC transporter substrate-binding protein [Glutamicibacter sp. NPDC087344]|uniref:ABC transporter substrate-binding protein n=1 Tax=Glutamicibacter sp. NPDC087344 TaxID=3363994 RepID=UPI003830F192